MKTLHLLRHAKAALHAENGDGDHGRPLAKRGLKAADAMAHHLMDADFTTDHVFCSTALRTRQTYDGLRKALRGVPISFRDDLYLVSSDDLLAFIGRLPENVDSALLIGHNPAFHTVGARLAGTATRGQAPALAQLREKYPTGALCSIAFDFPRWHEAALRKGTLVGFVRPRDLIDD